MGKDKSETKPKYTREFHSGERNKKEVKVPSKNLIQSEKRGQWSMKQFDQSYAEQLFELRENNFV